MKKRVRLVAPYWRLTEMIKSYRWRLVVLFLILSAPMVAAQESRGLSRDKVESIERAISTEMSRSGIPGLSVAVVTGLELRWSNGYGLVDLENFVPAKASTVYRLGSISKPITATAVMQLAERGKLDLDAAVQTYCPSFPVKPWPLSARQLLGHLGGIRHYKGPDEVNSTRRYNSLVEGLDIFKNDPLVHEPGTRYLYTTYGYSVLGCVVEGASGMKFTDFIRENIFQPAGMNRMRPDDVFDIIPNRAQGYSRTPSGQLRNSALADTSYKIPGGGLVSTVEDLAKFAVALQSGKLVGKVALEQMWTRQKTRDGGQTSYGLGWAISERDGFKEVAHGGAQQRVSTYLYMLPDKGLAVALMANLEGVGNRLQDLARQIAHIALQ